MTIAISALVTWVLTAGGGFVMLGRWLRQRGAAQGEAGTRLPAPVVFGHFGLAALGLVLWIIYLFTGSGALAWTSFVLLVPVALLGLGMFLRWLPQRRAGAARTPESSFPVAVVFGHGALAVVTVVLVLLAALEVGGS